MSPRGHDEAGGPHHPARPAIKRKVLLTGAAGRIGRHVVAAGAGRYDFVLTDVRTLPAEASHGFPFHQADLADRPKLMDLCQGVDSVVHLAAANFDMPWEAQLSSNIVGLYQLFEAAREARCRRVVFASSIQVVDGHPRHLEVPENAPARPGSLYGATKVWGEALGSLYADQRHFSVICLRLGRLVDRADIEKLPRRPELERLLTFDDFMRLLEAALEAPDDLHFGIYHGLSDNRSKRLGIERTRTDLGYRPQDDTHALAPGPVSSFVARAAARVRRDCAGAWTGIAGWRPDWLENLSHGTPRGSAKDACVYVAARAGGRRRILVFELDRTVGSLTRIHSAAGVEIPAFLAFHPRKPLLYAAGQSAGPGKELSGVVAAFALDGLGRPSLLNTQPAGGRGPCFVTVDRTGENVLVASAGPGCVSVVPIADDGRLAPPSTLIRLGDFYTAGHAHSITLDRAGRFAFVADLKLDELRAYRFCAGDGSLAAHADGTLRLSAGFGPRHFAFHPTGPYAYLCGEYSSTVIAFHYDSGAGTLTRLQELSTVPSGTAPGANTTAEILITPDGRFLYVSNRGHDSLAVFAVDEGSGELRVVGHCPSGGRTPRNFAIDPSGEFAIVANQDSNNLAVFRIPPETGMPLATGHGVRVPHPVCVRYL